MDPLPARRGAVSKDAHTSINDRGIDTFRMFFVFFSIFFSFMLLSIHKDVVKMEKGAWRCRFTSGSSFSHR